MTKVLRRRNLAATGTTPGTNITGWVRGHRSISQRLNWACNEAAVMERLLPDVEDLGEYRRGMLQQFAA